MRLVVIGLGVQGRKRKAIGAKDVVSTVDPINPEANFKAIQEVPLDHYDAAAVCVPDQEKLPILRYLLESGKHLLVEKPLLGAATELQKLHDLAGAKRLACYTAYNHRFEPHIARMKQLLEQGRFGPIYLARMFYGNGTARDVRNSPWRDQGLGVVADLGSHLLDIAHFLFAPLDARAEIWTVNCLENKAPDHVSFGIQGQPVLEFEATLLSWRNTFHLDIYGQAGSGHIDSLCKWGPARLTLRTRVLPSGRPAETVETLDQPDPTWQSEYQHFCQLCLAGGSNIENDIWIGERMDDLRKSSKSRQAT